MRRMPLLVCLSLIVIVCPRLWAGPSVDSEKKVIAVLEFDAPLLADEAWGLPPGLGQGVADMVIDELVSRGVTVVERARIEGILREQRISATGLDEATVARSLGKLLGADMVVAGSVLAFGAEKKVTRASPGAASIFGGVGRVRKEIRRTVVELSARLIDTKTGTILSSIDGHGEDISATTRSGASVRETGDDQPFHEASQAFVGAAGQMAAADVVSQLSAHIPGTAVRDVSGQVADVDGDRVVLNVGTRHGISRGDLLEVQRFDRNVMDPAAPDRILRRLMARVAVVVVEDSDERSSVTRVISIAEGEKLVTGLDITRF